MGLKGIFAAAAVSAVLMGSAANAAIVADGDFSSPSGGGSFTTYGSGSSFGPWLVTQGSIDLIGGYWQAPTAGGGSVDLDGAYQAGGISQALAIGPGSYTLKFFLSGNPDSSLGLKSVQVAVGSALQTFSFDTATAGNTHGAMGYVSKTLNFTTAGPTTLSFTSLDNRESAFGPVIGGVSVAGAPEPAAWIMMIGGFGMAGAMLRRRRGAQPA